MRIAAGEPAHAVRPQLYEDIRAAVAAELGHPPLTQEERTQVVADVNRHIKSGVLQIAPPSSGLLGCVLRCYLGHMTLKARVKAGRLVVESLTPEDADRYIKVIPPDCDDKRILARRTVSYLRQLADNPADSSPSA